MADSMSRPCHTHFEQEVSYLLGNDDLAVLVVTALGAYVMRELSGTATGAGALRGSRNLHVRRTTTMRANAALLLFRYWHDDLP